MKSRVFFAIFFAFAAIVCGRRLYLMNNAAESLTDRNGDFLFCVPKNRMHSVKVLSVKGAAFKKNPPYRVVDRNDCFRFALKTNLTYSKARIVVETDRKVSPTVVFSGPKKKGRRLNVDFRNFYLDGEREFEEKQAASYIDPLKYRFSMKKGDRSVIEFEHRRHLPAGSDICWWVLLTIAAVGAMAGWRFGGAFGPFAGRLAQRGKTGELLFLITLFAMLCVPASHIDRRVESKLENRRLVAWPELLLSGRYGQGAVKPSFGKYFEFWFNDRFFGRLQTLQARHAVQKLLRFRLKTSKAFIGRDGYIFRQPDLKANDPEYIGFLNKRFSWFVGKFINLRKWAKRNGIKMYVVILPVKEDVLFDKLGRGTPRDTAAFDDWLKRLGQRTGVDFVYPKRELIEAAANAKYPVAYKNDHHYTEYGTFFTYRLLMERIRRDFPDIPVLTENDFNVVLRPDIRNAGGDGWKRMTRSCVALMVMDDDECLRLSAPYPFYEYKRPDRVEITKSYPDFVYYKNRDGKHRLYLLGTSHVNQMAPILSYSFASAVKETGKTETMTKNKVLSAKPDVLVLMIQSTAFDELKVFFKD